jgi:hypothetical protein
MTSQVRFLVLVHTASHRYNSRFLISRKHRNITSLSPFSAMPKAAPKKGRAAGARTSPTKAKAKADPKPSHLYTDDNPSTTIRGTGFKDKAAAEKTLDLIKSRSLICQFQTVNTMYNRAKHHPAMKKAADGAASTADMRAAMDVFREWLDVTCPAQRAALRANGGFKPLLSKKTMSSSLPRIETSESVSSSAKVFAKVYAELPRGKKLGNVLVDDSKPQEPDWEAKRYSELCRLVPVGKEEADAWKDAELWDHDKEGDRVPTGRHLEMIAWAWTPVGEKKL